MWDGFNQRKFPRVSLECEVTIQPETQRTSFSTVTENLGTGGVCVILDRALDRFSNCRIRLGIPDRSAQIDCEGRVVWTVATRQPKARRARFDTGIEFLNLDPLDAERIRKFIKQGLRELPRKG